MEPTAQRLVHALRASNMRITTARTAICEVLADAADEHVSAVDIRQRAAERAGSSIDQSTVYRTLDVLEELGYLHHVHLGHGPGVYHLTKDAMHHHLVCESCGKRVDIPLDDVGPLLDAITAESGFVVDSLHFALTGRCEDCLNKGRQSPGVI